MESQNLIGFGVVEPNGVVATKDLINNANFEKVEMKKTEEKKEDPKK